MMTPKELLKIAKRINPEKLETDPQGALEDAYIIWQAGRLAEREKVSEPPDPREVSDYPTSKLPKEKKDCLDRLRRYMEKEDLTIAYVAKRIGISSSSLYHWLNGANNPMPDSIAKIEAYLTANNPVK